MLAAAIILFILAVATISILQLPQFGKTPSGERLERIKKSPNFRKGKFRNLQFTPPTAEDTNVLKIGFRFIFKKSRHAKPAKPFNFIKSDLHELDPAENFYIWMGHSSYFLQIDGKKFLVDPVFCGYASPFSFTTKAFAGSDLYIAEDIPEIDYLLISHDHYDHLDYKTLKKLKPKIKQVITGLGTGQHIEHWKYEPHRITELDWNEDADLGGGFKIYAEPARHFSGRGFKRDQAIWASFVIETPFNKIYLGGDSGFGSHYKKIGEKHGGFDLAILENGQYNEDWKYIHMLPKYFFQIIKDLNAQRIIPVHNSKFELSLHHWKEPMSIITKLNESENMRLITPKIGETVKWKDDETTYEKWWESLQ